MCRPGLDLRLRQVCTVSSLMALGSVQPQLKYHMIGLLNARGRPRDLVELLFVSITILGFPAAIDAIALVRELFKERQIRFEALVPASDDGTQRYRRGLEILSELGGEHHLQRIEAISPDLARWAVEFAYGEVLSREGLEPKARHLATISMAAATGDRDDALCFHLAAGIRQGLSREEITEALMQLSVYAGFPTALNAFSLAQQVLAAQRGCSTTGATAPAAPAQMSESRQLRRECGSPRLRRRRAPRAQRSSTASTMLHRISADDRRAFLWGCLLQARHRSQAA